jgi:hypothetical protein
MADQKAYYLQIKVPLQNFDQLMDDLSSNIGNIESKNIEVKGSDYYNNTLCEIRISLG